MLSDYSFKLPPFAHWTPQMWSQKGPEVRPIIERGLGWDVTDFGRGNFDSIGLSVFTLRNGSLEDLKKGRGMLYCEKIMAVGIDQVTPLHFHWAKTEDIINRGGGTLVVRLFNADETEQLADSDVTVRVDSIERIVAAGDTVRLSPGESITLESKCYHDFWAEGGPVLAGEVSVVNDDDEDNRFLEAGGRFPAIEEDEPAQYLMVKDYPSI